MNRVVMAWLASWGTIVFLGVFASEQSKPGELPPPALVSWNSPREPVQKVMPVWARPTGLQLEASAGLADKPCMLEVTNMPLWQALDLLSERVGGRWLVSADGRSLRLLPRAAGRPISAHAGPFRVAVQAVQVRLVPDTGESVCELKLLVHWEPRYPVYRIDSVPRIIAARDEHGRALSVLEGRSHQYPSGAAAEMSVRLQGIQRVAQRIALVDGSFRATLTDRLLNIVWESVPGTKPLIRSTEGIELAWKTLKRNSALHCWEVELEWLYPPDHPRFDSYEESKWLRDVQVQWRLPSGKLVQPVGEEIYATGRRVQAVCQFPEAVNPQENGWALLLTTPARLREVDISLRLQDIPLP